MLPHTREEEAAIDESMSCRICKQLYDKKNHKVHHHDHSNGKFIEAICNNCNLQIKWPKRQLKAQIMEEVFGSEHMVVGDSEELGDKDLKNRFLSPSFSTIQKITMPITSSNILKNALSQNSVNYLENPKFKKLK